MPVLSGRNLRKTFRRDTGEIVYALGGVNIDAEQGKLTALVGPDGGGKTTLLRLAAGLMTPDEGTLTVVEFDVVAEPQQVQDRISYMPQKFGLYEDLTVQENLNLYADLQGVPAAERRERYARLMHMTGLGPFTRRLAGQLSGGMKQKLGLACTLVRFPDLLLLDEPTVGVDPISRRELWDIILQLVHEQGLSVVLSTSYLDEAERCGQVIVLHQGQVLAHGPPEKVSELAAGRTFLAEPAPGQTARGLQARLLGDAGVIDAVPEGGKVRIVRRERQGAETAPSLAELSSPPVPVAPRFEDGFMVLLRQAMPAEASDRGKGFPARPADAPRNKEIDTLHTRTHGLGSPSHEVVVQVHDLVRKFGSFTAVDHVSFEVHRGEIFGLLGPNGAGKTTTFRMLCGLLAATEGNLLVAGVDLHFARASARQRIGYVAQKFSLYGQLTVTENLEFFGSAYGLSGKRIRERIDWALDQFELGALAKLPSGQLPGGYKQRLAMAAALLHEPEILFLDEPTSGADPLARRDFWQRITTLAEQGVTVIVTTHFMEEAEYCDRIVILDAGKVLAQGTPAEVRSHARPEPGRSPTMEDAFIAIVDKSRGSLAASRSPTPTGDPARGLASERDAKPQAASPLAKKARRVWALMQKEFRQILRDPSSVAIGVVLPLMLIVLFGLALSLDVKDAPLAIVLENPSPEALDLAASFQLSSYFKTQIVTSMQEAEQMMRERRVDGIVRVRSDFARHLGIGDAEVQVLVHGTDANSARIIQVYVQGAVGQWLARRAAEGHPVLAGPVGVRDRMWFNEASDSHYFLVPGLVVLVMTLIGAMLTALVVAREWERGTIEALFVTPVRAGEILIGKTLPYFALGLFGLGLCLFGAKFIFEVPFRGSIWTLTGTSMLYLLVALSVGLLISSAIKSQFVAIQVTMLVTFLPAMMLSGFMFDLHSMPVAVRWLAYALPASYYVTILQTVFLAGDIGGLILPNAAVLAGMAAGMMYLARRATKKKLD